MEQHSKTVSLNNSSMLDLTKRARLNSLRQHHPLPRAKHTKQISETTAPNLILEGMAAHKVIQNHFNHHKKALSSLINHDLKLIEDEDKKIRVFNLIQDNKIVNNQTDNSS